MRRCRRLRPACLRSTSHSDDDLDGRDLDQAEQVGLAVPAAADEANPRRSCRCVRERARRCGRGDSQGCGTCFEKIAPVHGGIPGSQLAKSKHAATLCRGCWFSGDQSGSVWESNPQRALFKPSTGFEDQGPHQRCKHSRIPCDFRRKSHCQQGFLIVLAWRWCVHLPGITYRPASRAGPLPTLRAQAARKMRTDNGSCKGGFARVAYARFLHVRSSSKLGGPVGPFITREMARMR